MDSQLRIRYASSKSGVQIDLYPAGQEERKAVTLRSGDTLMTLHFKNERGKDIFSRDLPDQKVLNAAARLAEMSPITLISSSPGLRRINCSCHHDIDEIQMGTFLIFLARYVGQSK